MRTLISLLVLHFAFVACATSKEPPSDKPYNVVTTTAMIGDVVQTIAGDRADVQTLIGPGVDPHLYRPTRDDIRSLMQADVVIYNGLNLEGKMSDTFVQVARTGKLVVAVSEGVDEAYPITDPRTGHSDPHLWMDPNGWIKATDVITEALCTYDPAYAETYRSNAAAYLAELRALDIYARTSITTIPESRRVLITAHDAFNYMARAYALEVKGIQGISTESEAGLKFIEELIDVIVDRQIKAVFTESSVSKKNIEALVEGAAARQHVITIGGMLYSDAMGAPGTYEGTYIGMIDHNITTIARALGGSVPKRGMRGKLSEKAGAH